MKLSRYTLISFLLLIVIAAIYRAIPGRPWGFAPQFAMAIFGGSVLKDKKMSFFLPILSLLISDFLYEILFINGLTDIQGFYSGQIENYLLFASLTFVGFFVNQKNVASVAKGSLASPTLFFFASARGTSNIRCFCAEKTQAPCTNSRSLEATCTPCAKS